MSNTIPEPKKWHPEIMKGNVPKHNIKKWLSHERDSDSYRSCLSEDQLEERKFLQWEERESAREERKRRFENDED